ncbi:bolA-like protein [Ceratobasidium theobromae]|uniref:BolA-like protein n=1 Tax=Ceratobasidium theobromae TaxID=1582974 RepID=A0A5N5QED7_9AGAM|nr:bolA-like protein [Ceratobasidium theobromae]
MPINATALEKSLRDAFGPTHLEITDTSNGCGENYAVVIVSDKFVGKPTLARHRLVNELLKNDISQMHAFSQVSYLSISSAPPEIPSILQTTYTPQQWEALQAKSES